MPDIDRTQVVIETQMDTTESDKKIDRLERKLDGLNKTVKIDFDIDDALKAIDKKTQELLKEINHGYNRGENVSSQWKQYRELNWARGHIYEDKDALTKADLDDLLSSIGFKLDNDTIEQIGQVDQGGNDTVEALKDNALEMHDLIQQFNGLAAQYKNREKDGKSQKEVDKIVTKMDEIKAKLIKMGVDEKAFQGQKSLSYKDAWNSYVKDKNEKEPASDKKDPTMGKILGALVGIRSLFTFVRRIAAQNEHITAAIDNLVSALAAALAPVIDLLAVIINTIATFLGGIFGFSKKTATSTGSMAKTLAGFDEINNIGGGSGGGSGPSTGKVGIDDQLLLALNGLKDIILGIIKVIWDAIKLVAAGLVTGLRLIVATIAEAVGLVVATVSGIVSGLTNSIIALVTGIWNTVKTLIQDIITAIAGIFTSFVEGYKKARDEGKSVIVAVFEGLWNSFKTTVANIWNLIKDLFVNLWDILKGVVTGFVEGFKTSFMAVYNWVNDKVVNPIIQSIKNLYDSFIKPTLDHMIGAWNQIRNGFRNMINGVIGFINNVIWGLNKIPGVNISGISYMATGGFPDVGQLFIAREAGPEMVGKIGSQNAVVNNEQIIEGIKRGVMKAMSASGNSQSINLYLDGKQITDVVVKGIRQQSRVLGRSVI